MMLLKQSVQAFQPISLSNLNEVALLKRTDTKFILHVSKLPEILDKLRQHYKMLEIEGNRFMTYNTIYFDTENYHFYNDHHNGKVRRVKVRKRVYKESALCFLEVKKKDGKGNTTKFRKQINNANFKDGLNDESLDFVNSTIFNTDKLHQTLANSFQRLTLASKARKERITIDLNLNFSNNTDKKAFKDLVIIEVKQERINRNSPILTILKSQGFHPYRLSKYCIGMASLYKDVKYNKFKKKLLQIQKLTA